ncbi:MAG: lipopolysaccharide transport periplasmic protein LptA [Litorilituus sp.]|nr:lipopolysaccharide transport periplasmic protein LptA [Litorilituus sp.]
MKKNMNKTIGSSPRFPSIKSLAAGIVIMGLALSIATPSLAAKKDLSQEITIKSKRQSADLKNKIASYLDEVSIYQGSIAITADIVQVFSKTNKKTGESFDTYLAKGKPALFQQQLEDGSLISLQANEIKYQPEVNIITISGNAQVKQAGSKVTGNTITYNTLSEQLEAQSTNDEAVTTVLQPAQIKAQQEKNKTDTKNNIDNDNND